VFYTFKMIASDIDGTLIYKSDYPSKRTKNAIKAVTMRGIPFVLTTGRRIASTKTISYAFDITENPIITNCGACISIPSRNNILHANHIPKDIAFEIGKIAFTSGVNAAFYENVYDGNNIYTFSTEHLHWMASHSPWYASFFEKIDIKNDSLINDPIQLCLSGTSEAMKKAKSLIQAEFKDDITLMDYGVLKHGDHIMDIFASDTSKANALEWLLGSYGFSKSELIAFGDGINDSEMLNVAGLSVAMDNAPQYLKQKAKIVAPSNKDEGVAHVIEELIAKNLLASLK